MICILGVPIAGIAAIGAASARQFILGDREFVHLPASITSSRRLPFPMSLEIAHRK